MEFRSVNGYKWWEEIKPWKKPCRETIPVFRSAQVLWFFQRYTDAFRRTIYVSNRTYLCSKEEWKRNEKKIVIDVSRVPFGCISLIKKYLLSIAMGYNKYHVKIEHPHFFQNVIEMLSFADSQRKSFFIRIKRR